MRVILLGLAGLSYGCSIDIENCAIPCVHSCPQNLECRAGSCVHPQFSGNCGGATPELDATTGGALPDGGGGEPDAARASTLAQPGCESGGALQITPCPLPAPCAGVPYSLSLGVAGGTPPYQWTATAVPEGLRVSSDGQLSGVTRQSGELSVVVADRDGQTARARYAVEPRGSCWFAYTPNEPGAPVELFDRLLSDGSTGLVRLPAQEGSANVESFTFSPDGRFLAVRTVGTAVEAQLRLFAAPEWRELPFELGVSGRLGHLAWSGDGAVLALTVENEQGSLLGGLRVAPGDVVSGLAPRATALRFSSAPVEFSLDWFASSRVVLVGRGGDDDPESRRLYFAASASDGFDAIATYEFASYASSLRLEAGPTGFFVVVQFMNLPPAVDFYAPGEAGLSLIVHRNDVVFSPTLRHAAHATSAGELWVYPASELRVSPDDETSPLPLGVQAGCNKLLAWSARGDTLACWSDGAKGGAVRMFELGEEARDVRAKATLEGSYVYSAEESALRRRALSVNARWFAFTTTSELYLAELAADRAVVSQAAIPLLYLANPNAAFEFSPDETHLLHHQGSSLWLRHLPSSTGADLFLSGALPDSLECSERGSAARGTWCGSPGGAPNLAWSPDSHAMAYRVTAGAPISVAVPDAHGVRTIACGPACGAFAFQP